jgi:hypothetical protein
LYAELVLASVDCFNEDDVISAARDADAILVRENSDEKTELDTLFEESDFISLHLPLTPETKHIFSAAALERMKKGTSNSCRSGGSAGAFRRDADLLGKSVVGGFC